MPDFDLLNCWQVCVWSFNFLIVVGLLILRWREPSLERFVAYFFLVNGHELTQSYNISRPYRTFWLTPVLFALTSLFIIGTSYVTKPLESLVASLFCVAGCVPYFIQKRSERSGGFQQHFIPFPPQLTMTPPTAREQVEKGIEMLRVP